MTHLFFREVHILLESMLASLSEQHSNDVVHPESCQLEPYPMPRFTSMLTRLVTESAATTASRRSVRNHLIAPQPSQSMTMPTNTKADTTNGSNNKTRGQRQRGSSILRRTLFPRINNNTRDGNSNRLFPFLSTSDDKKTKHHQQPSIKVVDSRGDNNSVDEWISSANEALSSSPCIEVYTVSSYHSASSSEDGTPTTTTANTTGNNSTATITLSNASTPSIVSEPSVSSSSSSSLSSSSSSKSSSIQQCSSDVVTPSSSSPSSKLLLPLSSPPPQQRLSILETLGSTSSPNNSNTRHHHQQQDLLLERLSIARQWKYSSRHHIYASKSIVEMNGIMEEYTAWKKSRSVTHDEKKLVSYAPNLCLDWPKSWNMP